MNEFLELIKKAAKCAYFYYYQDFKANEITFTALPYYDNGKYKLAVKNMYTQF